MPVVNFQLVEGLHTDAQLRTLLIEASALYASVLESPIDRVRVFINLRPAHLVAVGGVPLNEGGTYAPFFDCFVMAGRSLEQRHLVLAGFTDLLVKVLGVDRSQIRGVCRPVDPENWAIAGVPASIQRAAEIEARAKLAATNIQSPATTARE
jgi:phenylpyruvate tautomerase PptA (4-oxalocrotonate tautomerase family)